MVVSQEAGGDSMTTLYHAACQYLRAGFHPIPCAPRSKRPLVEWKRYQEEPPLPEELSVWWEEHPDANIALVLGRGTFAIDLDGAEAAEVLLEAEGIQLPEEAPRSRTASGFHVFLATPHPIPDRVALLSTNGGKPQVDVRGVGIVVVPPSVHPTGVSYQWIHSLSLPLPRAPEQLLHLIQMGRRGPLEAETAPTWMLGALQGVAEGQRDVVCTRLAGYFLGKGLPIELVEALLVETFGRRCRPPFPREDIHKCVRSIASRESKNGEDRASALEPLTLGASLDTLLRQIESGPPHTTRTPFPSLNHLLSGGLSPGELVFVGARPGVGKTALGLEFARTTARNGGSVLVVSREMVHTALTRRMLAQEARVSASALKTGGLSLEQRGKVNQALSQLRGLPVWLSDRAVSLEEIQGLVAGFKGDPALGLLVVDYLQLVRAPRGIGERRLQVEAVSWGLKTLALQYRLPVLCLSSLSRSADKKDTHPSLDSLRESGELEHTADIVLLLHREFGKAETECLVAKNRDGRTGLVKLLFKAEFVAFEESPP